MKHKTIAMGYADHHNGFLPKCKDAVSLLKALHQSDLRIDPYGGTSIRYGVNVKLSTKN